MLCDWQLLVMEKRNISCFFPFVLFVCLFIWKQSADFYLPTPTPPRVQTTKAHPLKSWKWFYWNRTWTEICAKLCLLIVYIRELKFLNETELSPPSFRSNSTFFLYPINPYSSNMIIVTISIFMLDREIYYSLQNNRKKFIGSKKWQFTSMAKSSRKEKAAIF